MQDIYYADLREVLPDMGGIGTILKNMKREVREAASVLAAWSCLVLGAAWCCLVLGSKYMVSVSVAVWCVCLCNVGMKGL